MHKLHLIQLSLKVDGFPVSVTGVSSQGRRVDVSPEPQRKMCVANPGFECLCLSQLGLWFTLHVVARLPVLLCPQPLAFLASLSLSAHSRCPAPSLTALHLYFYDPSGLSASEQVGRFDMGSHYIAHTGPGLGLVGFSGPLGLELCSGICHSAVL